MGKNSKKGPKQNVFKVAGAKSLKKSKAKAVNLGLKNIKQKVGDLDKQFLDTSRNTSAIKKPKPEVKLPEKKSDKKKVTNEELATAVGKIDKMDIL